MTLNNYCEGSHCIMNTITITVCDGCVCAPICMNKPYDDLINQCSLVQDEIRSYFNNMDTRYIRFTINVAGDVHFSTTRVSTISNVIDICRFNVDGKYLAHVATINQIREGQYDV